MTTPFETAETLQQTQQWFDGDNLIHSTVEKLSKIETPDEAASMVDNLNDASGYYQFVLGGVLAEIHKRDWAGQGEAFYSHVTERHGIKKRKVQYLTSVFTALVDLDIPWDNAKQVGWSNLRALAPILTNDNVGEWLSKAAGKTHAEVLAMLKEYKSGGTVPTNGESTPQKKFTFVIHEDQVPTIEEAISKAKSEGNTKYDGMALEYMAMDYLAGGKKETPSVTAMFEKIRAAADSDDIAVDLIMEAFCGVFTNAHVEIELDKEEEITAGEEVE